MIYFHILFFSYVPGLYFVSSRMWYLSTYYEEEKVWESTVSLFPIESNWPNHEYYFPPYVDRDTEPKSKYHLEKYFNIA